MTDARQEFLKDARSLAQGLLDYAMTVGKDRGITDARISVTAQETEQNAVEKGAVAKAQSGSTRRVEVALFAGDRTLTFTRNSTDPEALKAAIRENLKVIHMVPANADKRPLETAALYTGDKPDLDLYDTNPPDSKAMIDYARTVENAALAQEGVKTTRSVSMSKNTTHNLILGTNGLDYADSRTIYSAGASVIAEDASGMQVDGESSIARHFSDMAEPHQLGVESGRAAAAKLGARLPDTGVMPVVLSHDAAQDFFRAVQSAISGGNIHRGASFFKDKIGAQVMANGVTLVDDPTIPRGIGSGSVDVTGQKAEKTTFIEDGVLKSYNVSLLEARQLGIAPMGREEGSTNSRVLPGAQTPAELIKDIKDGIYIKDFSGGTVDINSGLHSRQAHGTLIKDGKITDIAVSGFVVSGNLKEMFMNVVLANDTPKQPGKYTLAAPTTRINGVTIAGK